MKKERIKKEFFFGGAKLVSTDVMMNHFIGIPLVFQALTSPLLLVRLECFNNILSILTAPWFIHDGC